MIGHSEDPVCPTQRKIRHADGRAAAFPALRRCSWSLSQRVDATVRALEYDGVVSVQPGGARYTQAPATAAGEALRKTRRLSRRSVPSVERSKAAVPPMRRATHGGTIGCVVMLW